MTTAKELIEFLQSIPEDTEIEVVETDIRGYSMVANEVALDLKPLDTIFYSENMTYYDFSDAVDGNLKGRRILVLGNA